MHTLWKLPFPSSALSGYEMSCDVRRDDKLVLIIKVNEEEEIELRFHDVYATKCTFDPACTVEMIDSYDTVIDVGDSEFLKSTRYQLRRSDHELTTLRHLMIYFDDGPCYEFICRDFTFEPKVYPIREPVNYET